MRVIPVDQCKEGMIIAKPIINKYGLSLIEANVTLTPSLIETLKRRSVKVVYIKDDKTKGALGSSKQHALKPWILFFISVLFIVIMCIKSMEPSTQLVPITDSFAYQLISIVSFFVIIVQQIMIAWFKKNQFWSTIFQQIASFFFSYNILTLAVMYFQNSVLKQPNWIYFYLLIFFQLFILAVILTAWKITK